MDFSGKEGPGPGEYEPFQKNASVVEHAHIRTDDRAAQFDARLPRYHELVVKQEQKKVSPCSNHTLALDLIDFGSPTTMY